MTNKGFGKDGDNVVYSTFARMYFVNVAKAIFALKVLHQHFQNTPRGGSERFAWASCSTRIPPRRILHHSQPAASLLQNAYSAPPLALQSQFTGDTPIASPRASALRVLPSQHVCYPRGFLGSAVTDGGDSLEATHRGDAIRFASALMEGASVCCESEGTPNIKSDAIVCRRCCCRSLTAQSPGPLVNLPPHLPRARLFVEVIARPLPQPHTCDALLTSWKWSQPWKTP